MIIIKLSNRDIDGSCPNLQYIKMGQNRPLFVYFCSLLTQILQKKL